jgi:hypothetical protein
MLSQRLGTPGDATVQTVKRFPVDVPDVFQFWSTFPRKVFPPMKLWLPLMFRPM